jgi:hypothetical protein
VLAAFYALNVLLDVLAQLLPGRQTGKGFDTGIDAHGRFRYEFGSGLHLKAELDAGPGNDVRFKAFAPLRQLVKVTVIPDREIKPQTTTYTREM